MNKLLDKVGLIICCAVGLYPFKNPLIQVTALLLSILFSSLSQCYPKSKISFFNELLYIIICFLNPIFVLFLPLIIYDCLSDKQVYLAITSIIPFLIHVNKFRYWQIVLMIGCLGISIISQYHTKQMEFLNQKLIETRDNSEEINLLLLQKNKHLIESQDNEIYLATLQERNRIAREIHDNVGHMLSRSILQVGALLIINKDETQKESLESLKNTLNTAMDSIRSSVHNLHDDSIDLKENINEMIEPMKENYSINLDLDFSENIPKNIKICFIGVVKEGLSNIIRHSNATKVNIIIREHPAFYQLAIEDNGENTEQKSENGLGLLNMQDRVKALNGLIEFYQNKNGFKIFVSITKKS